MLSEQERERIAEHRYDTTAGMRYNVNTRSSHMRQSNRAAKHRTARNDPTARRAIRNVVYSTTTDRPPNALRG